MGKNIAALYCRLSDEDKNKASDSDESKSIQNQKSMLVSYAAEKGWEIYRIYSDDDYSGAYSDEENSRPDFKRMIEDAKEGRFNIILCKSQSRFSRNIEMIEHYIHGRFTEWGIRFVSIVDNADTDVAGNKKARQIMGLANEWYLEDLSENIRSVLADKMKRGECLFSFPPYGYKKDENIKNHLVTDGNTAPVVRQIFTWREEGYGAAKIARMLNDMRVPSPRKQQELYGYRKKLMYSSAESGTWSPGTVSDILQNRMYCGDIVQHRMSKLSYKSKKTVRTDESEWIIKQNVHDAIISRDRFLNLQHSGSKRPKSDNGGKVHLLSGMVFCAECGRPMQKNHTRMKSGKTADYLRCRERYSRSEPDRCSTPNVRYDAVTDAICIGLIKSASEEYMESDECKALSAKLAAETISDNVCGTDALKKEWEEADRILNELYCDKLSGLISREQYTAFSERYEHIKAELDRKISECGNHAATDKDNAVISYFEKKDYMKRIIAALVRRIEISSTCGTELRVYWNI